MCLETGLPFPRASTGYGNELNKISWVSEITNAKSCTWSRLIPAIRTHRGPPSWEAALLGKDPGLLVDSQLDTSHWHHWRLRAFWSKKRQQQTGASPAGASTAVRCWRLCPVRSGQGRGLIQPRDESAAGRTSQQPPSTWGDDWKDSGHKLKKESF